MITQAKYIDYLLSTLRNYTCTHLAAHLPGVSHDEVNRFLRNSAFSANQLRTLVLPLLHDSPEAFLLVDDSVQDKRYSRFIEVAKRQYSGAVHGPVTAPSRASAWSTWCTAAGSVGTFEVVQLRWTV